MNSHIKPFLGASVKVSLFFVLIMSFVTVLLLGLLVFYRPTSLIELLQQFQPSPTQTPFTIKGVGVIGDSQSDEYRADDRRGSTYASTTMNWVELLAKYRKVDFGEWGLWEEPRRTGYAYNYARSGATANSMIISGQHIGVAQQVKDGNVNLVIIYIGSNDFAPYITNDGYQAIYDGSISRAEILRKENILVANIKTAIDTIRDAGNAKILLIKIPDWGNHIGVQISNVINETNNQLEILAKTYSIPTIDPNDFYKTINESNGKNGVEIAGETFTRVIPSDDPHSLVLDDGVHPGTVMNGLFANYVMRALNTNIGTSLKPFSQKEIFSAAGL
jgi:lysophospholipase L1-like esterase